MALSASSSSVEKFRDASQNFLEKSRHGDLYPEDIPEESNNDEGDIKMAEPSGLAPVSFTAMFRSVVKSLATSTRLLIPVVQICHQVRVIPRLYWTCSCCCGWCRTGMSISIEYI